MKIIALKYPITLDGREVKEVSIRRPKVKDHLAVESLSERRSEQEIILMANLCGLPIEAIREFDMADYKALQGALADFLE